MDTGLEEVKALKGDRPKDPGELKGKSRAKQEEGRTGKDGRRGGSDMPGCYEIAQKGFQTTAGSLELWRTTFSIN